MDLDLENVTETLNKRSKRPKLDKEHSEAWYDLGAPIYLPTVKFIISIVQYSIDNYFLIKNTYNALVHTEENDEMESTHPKIIAGCTIGLHVFSSILISVIDSFNKDALSPTRRNKTLFQKKYTIGLRMLAHITLTMKLLRYVTVYLENKQRNNKIHEIRQRRIPIKKKEISFVVDQRKNSLVESHYDLIESFFKTVPGALLQVYFMFKSNPDARLRLYSTTDQDRFATVFITVITGAISVVNYQADYMAYKKVLIFQDYFASEFKHKINLNVPGDVCFFSNIPVQLLTIGIRMFFYCMLIFVNPLVFLITIGVLLLLSWQVGLFWTKTSWRLRPILENPLYGTSWISFDIIDLWLNLFVPGVHYHKFVDYVWNMFAISIVGVIVVKGYQSLTHVDYTSMSMSTIVQSFTTNPYQNTASPSDAMRNLTQTDAEDTEKVHFIGYVINLLLKAHDLFTFNQILYAEFFTKVVTHANLANILCLVYVCVLNGLGYIDLDFPVQIARNVNRRILQNFSELRNLEMEVGQNKLKEFIVLSLLTNSQFFCVLERKWFTKKLVLDNKQLDTILESIEESDLSESVDKGIVKLLRSVRQAIGTWCFPTLDRVPKINWDIPSDKNSIESSIAGHSLQQLFQTELIDPVYEEDNTKLNKLLAVFCSHFDEISRNMTSYRLSTLAKYFSVDLDNPHGKNETRVIEIAEPLNSNCFNFETSRSLKEYYQDNYIRRILRVFNKSDKYKYSVDLETED